MGLTVVAPVDDVDDNVVNERVFSPDKTLRLPDASTAFILNMYVVFGFKLTTVIE